MKRFFALLISFVLLCLPVAQAEPVDIANQTDDELNSLTAEVIAEQIKRGKTHADILVLSELSDENLIALAEAIAVEQQNRGYTTYSVTLEKGSKGEEVRALQNRLIELNYLSGSADGSYGGKTATAIELFQAEVGLTVTGTADPATQEALFADDAPKAKVYLELDFNAISRDPDNYIDVNYQFDGKVLQVMEEEYEGQTIVALRIATKGKYDNVVYVMYIRKAGESRILEDDRVSVRGTCKGLYSYTSVRGNEITLPYFIAETVVMN